MNAYGAIAVVFGVLGAAHTRATLTLGAAHGSFPVLWLLGAAVVLTLVFGVLWLARSIMRDGGLWLAAKPAVTP